MLGRRQRVGVRDVERREAQPHDVRLAEVADDAARDQRLDDGVRLGWRSETCDPRRSSSRGVTTSRSTPSASRQSRKNPVSESDCGPHVGHGQPVVRRRARPPARAATAAGAVPTRARVMPSAGAVVRAHRERRARARASRSAGWSNVVLVARGDVDEGRRARPAVEVLVAAADGEVGPVRRPGPRRTTPAEWHRSQHASAPTSCAARVIAAQVPELAGAVVDLAEQDASARSSPSSATAASASPEVTSTTSRPAAGRPSRACRGRWGRTRVGEHHAAPGAHPRRRRRTP